MNPKSHLNILNYYEKSTNGLSGFVLLNDIGLLLLIHSIYIANGMLTVVGGRAFEKNLSI